MKTKIIYILVVFVIGFSLMGNIYFWKDKEGVPHYSNVNTPGSGNIQEIKETNKIFQQLNKRKSQTHQFKVEKVYDGDTIRVRGMGFVFKVRLVGIDAPEIGYDGQRSQPFSQQSKSYLKSLIDQQWVRIKSHGIGGFNRQLAEVFVGNLNINIEMIRAGLAEVYRGKKPSSLDSQTYLNEESHARNFRKGMWVQRSSYQSPKQWRKTHPRR